MQDGVFPSCYKRAQVLPLLKKAGLNSSSPAIYRPVSNLSTLSKVLERLVLTRLRPHLLGSANFSEFQSAYRKCHSTVTALLQILHEVFTAADDKQVTTLICLDLSAAFDTVDHSILLERLQSRVQCDRNAIRLAPLIPHRPDAVRQNGSTPVASC